MLIQECAISSNESHGVQTAVDYILVEQLFLKQFVGVNAMWLFDIYTPRPFFVFQRLLSVFLTTERPFPTPNSVLLSTAI